MPPSQAIKYEAVPEDYSTVSVLGRGITQMATVLLSVHTPSDTWVALKQYNLDNIDNENAELIKEEVILMRQLNHPCILPSLGSFVSGNKVVCILPLMGFGSTADLLARYFPTGLPEPVVATVLKAVLQALHYLHSKGIIHRAVRGSHILVSSDGYVKLSGLRYSCGLVSSERWNRKVHSFPPTTEPNLNWLSPELLQQNLEGYNEKSDVYSVGITTCELANGIVPYLGTCKTLMLTEKVKGIQPQLIDASTFIPNGPDEEEGMGEGSYKEEEDEISRVVRTRRFSDAFHSITEFCLERDPNSRPSPKQLLSHSFFKSVLTPLGLLQTLAAYVDPTDQPYQEEESSSGACEMMNNLELESVDWDF